MSTGVAAIAGAISGASISAIFCNAANLDSTCIGIGAGIGALSGVMTWCGSGGAAMVKESLLVPAFITIASITTATMIGMSYALNIHPLTVMGFTAAGSSVVGTLAGAATYHSSKLSKCFSIFKSTDNTAIITDIQNNVTTENVLSMI